MSAPAAAHAAPEPALPMSKEAEAGLISLAINHAECLYRLDEAGITETYFSNHDAAYLFGLLKDLTEQGKGAHPGLFAIVQAIKKLGSQGQGTYEYYSRAATEYIPAEWFDKYLKELIECHKRRELIRMAGELTNLAYDKSVPTDAAILYSLSETEKIDQVSQPLNVLDGQGLAEMMREYYSNADKRPAGANTGITILDTFTGGTRLGELTLLYAPPGKGKSAIFQQICFFRAVTLGRPQLWITIGDMTISQVINRFMQQETGVSSINLSQGDFRDGEGFNHWRKIESHLKSLEAAPLFTYENETLKSTDVRRIIKRLLRQVSFLDVYIDHIGQFTDPAENIYMKTVNVATSLLSCAHGIRDEAGNPLVSINAISPINKQGKYAGAMDLGHAAENIYTLEPLKPQDGGPDPDLKPSEQSGLVNFRIEKSRHGGQGALTLYFDAPRAKFFGVSDREGRR